MALTTGSRLALTTQDVTPPGCGLVADPITAACGDESVDGCRQSAEIAASWELCALRLADDYLVRVDRAGRSGRLRYVAVARSLSVRPYAVVTSDPAELLQALGCTDIRPVPPAGPRATW